MLSAMAPSSGAQSLPLIQGTAGIAGKVLEQARIEVLERSRAVGGKQVEIGMIGDAVKGLGQGPLHDQNHRQRVT